MKIPKFDKETFKKEFEDSVLKTAADESELMRLTRILGTRFSVRIVCIITSILIFMTLNYFINILGCLLSGRGSVISFFNFFKISFRNIGSHSFIGFLYLFLIIVLVVHNVRMVYLFGINLKAQNVGQKGVSRWSTKEEIKAQYKEIDDREIRFPGHGGIPVCRMGDKLYIDDTNTNTIHIGITRSGKGETFVIPEIDIYSRAEQQDSIVALDLKSELIKTSYKPLAALGYEVQFLNIENPELGIQYNPLYLILQCYKEGNISDAELLCNSFAYSIFSSSETSSGDNNAEFFLSNATSAVTALILSHIADCLDEDNRKNAAYKLSWFAKQKAFKELSMEEQVHYIQLFKETKDFTVMQKEKFSDGDEIIEQILDIMDYIPDNAEYIPYTKNEACVNMFSVVNAFSSMAREYINDHLTKLDIYFQSRPALDRAKGIYASIEVSGDRTKGSIFSQALTKLNLYTFDNIAKLTSNSTFDLTDLGFGKKPVALFIGVPFYDRSKDSLVSTLVGQIFSANSRRAAKTKDLKCPRRIIYHLDEIGNYPAIKDFKTMLSVGLGTNQIFNLFIQTYNQIDSTYGKDADTIKDNCGNHIYIQTISDDTAKYFASILGNKTITNVSRTGKAISLDKTITETYEEKPLLNSNELMELREGENVVKRVMKRTSLQGEKVKPRAIFNNIDDDTSFKYRYEYLGDIYRNPDSVEWSEISVARSDFSKMELDDIVYDYNISFSKYEYEYLQRKAQSGEEMEPEEVDILNHYIGIFQFDQSVSSLPNYHLICETLEECNISLSRKETISGLVNKLLQEEQSEYKNIPKITTEKVYSMLLAAQKSTTSADSQSSRQAVANESNSDSSGYEEYIDLYDQFENMDI